MTETTSHASRDLIAELQARIAQLERSERELRAIQQSLVQEIAERKRVEAALQESEERLRLTQQVAHIGTFEWNIQTGVDRWTTELEAMYGLPPGGFAGTQAAWEQFVHPEDRPEMVRRVEQALQGATFEGEWRIIRPDGSMRWMAGTARVFKDASGEPQRLLGVNLDITDRKLAELQLHKAHEELERRVEERTAALTRSEQAEREQMRVLQSILDSMTDGVAVADTQGKFLLFNPAGERILGLGATDGPPSQWSQLYGIFQLDGRMPFSTEELPLVRAMRGEVVRGRELLVRNVHTSGDLVISVNASPLLDDAGHVMGGVAVFRDVTEQRRAQAKLAESEERLRAVVSNSPILLWSVNQDGVFTLSEGKALEKLGLRPGEVVGRSAFEMYRDVPRIVTRLKRALAGEEVDDLAEVRGSYFQSRYVPVRGADGCIVGANGVATDVTSRIEAEHALRDSEARLEQEQQVLRKMLELEDRERKLVANEIHDGFVQYVVGAQMRLETLRHQLAAGEPAAEGAVDGALALLQTGIAEARRLIGGLRPMIIDEMGLVEAISHLIADPQFCQGVAISFAHHVQFPSLEPMLEATLLRIVQEAITNIRRHSGSRRAEVRLVQEGNRLQLEIEDYGRGFDVQAVPPQRFGLRSMQERARLFGGRAEITSQIGVGTKVAVNVPITPAASPEL